MGSVQVGLKLSWQGSEFPSYGSYFLCADIVEKELRKVESYEITVENEKVK